MTRKISYSLKRINMKQESCMGHVPVLSHVKRICVGGNFFYQGTPLAPSRALCTPVIHIRGTFQVTSSPTVKRKGGNPYLMARKGIDWTLVTDIHRNPLAQLPPNVYPVDSWSFSSLRSCSLSFHVRSVLLLHFFLWFYLAAVIISVPFWVNLLGKHTIISSEHFGSHTR